MSEILETVKVEDERAPGGYFLLNKSDFNPEVHKLHEAPAPELSSPEGDEKPPEGDEKSKPKAKK